MLKRKILKRLEKFYNDDGKYALLIDGARQVGKTFIIEEFGRAHYESVVKIDFVKMKGATEIFADVEDEGEILERISAFSRAKLIPKKTLIFLDEIQKCPEAVTYLKYLVRDDGRYHYILSGSLLGIELKDIRSVPVGVLDEEKMYPLDFEEFVLACGESPLLITKAQEAWNVRKPLAKVYHDRLKKLFRFYLVVGGMPAVVQKYLDTRDIQRVVEEQKKIFIDYKKDITQYDDQQAMRIRAVFDCIASELNKKNKRFYAGDVEGGGRFDRLDGEFLWLEAAGVALPVYNLDEPKIPLRLAQKRNFFKLFLNDVGLLAAMYMDGIQSEILNGNTNLNFGAIYENFVAQELIAHGWNANYYNSREHGELDFVVECRGKVLPIEVKSGKHYARHRALDNVMRSEEFEIEYALVFDDDKLSVADRIFYAPIYMVMFLIRNDTPETMIVDIGEPVKFD